MSLENRDRAYVWDMLESAKEILEFTKGVSLSQYMSDRMRQRAVERCVEIIGEAARKVSDGFKKTNTQIPWLSIIAQRNVIAHEYGEIKQERIWALATSKIEELIEQLEPLVSELEEEGEEN